MAEGTSTKRKYENDNTESDKKGAKKFAGHWNQGLLASMNDPDLVVESDDKLTVIKDKYPKLCIYDSYSEQICVYHCLFYFPFMNRTEQFMSNTFLGPRHVALSRII